MSQRNSTFFPLGQFHLRSGIYHLLFGFSISTKSISGKVLPGQKGAINNSSTITTTLDRFEMKRICIHKYKKRGTFYVTYLYLPICFPKMAEKINPFIMFEIFIP